MGPTEFLRKWLCLNKRFKRTSSGSGCRSFKKIAAQGFAHHPYGPTERVPKTRDVINMLAIRQLGKYLDQAARAGRITAKLPIYNTEFGLQSNPPDRTREHEPRAPGGADQREGGVRVPLLPAEEPLPVPADRRSGARGRRVGEVVGLPDRPAVRGRAPQEPPTTRTGSRSWSRRAARASSIWGRVRPGSGVRSVQLQKGGAQLRPAREDELARATSASSGPSRAATDSRPTTRTAWCSGTSRTAKPIRRIGR